MSLRQHTLDLGTKPLGSLLIKLSIPGMISFLAMMLYNIVDTFWVSRLGAPAIAALTVVFPYQMINVAIGAGSGIGVSSLVSRLFGAKDAKGANLVAGQVYFLATVLGLITLAVGVFLTDPVLRLFGARPDFLKLAHIYLFIVAFGAPMRYFWMMSNNLVRGSGDALTPMYIALTTSILNAVLDPFLIFGWGPFPEMGVGGAALATIILQTAGAGFYLFYLSGKRSPYRIKLSAMVPCWRIIYDIYRVGLPSILMMLIGSIVIIFYNQFLRPFGTIAIAAYGLLFRIVQLFMMPIVGMSQGLMPIVGYNFGARNLRRMWAGVRTATLYATVVTGTAQVLLLTLATPVAAVFSRSPDLLATTTYGIRVYSLALIFVGAQFMWITTLQGMGRGRDALIISVLRQVVFLVPLMWLFSRYFKLSGIWAAQPVSDVLAFIVTAIWIWHVRCRIGSQEKGKGIPPVRKGA